MRSCPNLPLNTVLLLYCLKETPSNLYLSCLYFVWECVYVCGYIYRGFCICGSDPADSTCSLALLCDLFLLCVISDLKSPVDKHPNPILPGCGYPGLHFVTVLFVLCTVLHQSYSWAVFPCSACSWLLRSWWYICHLSFYKSTVEASCHVQHDGMELD